MNLIKSDLTALQQIVEANKVAPAIAASQGRVLMAEVVVSTPNKYSSISNVKLLNGFGADMITLKKYDYLRYQNSNYQDYQNISSLIGLNFEIKFDTVELDTFCDEHLAAIDLAKVDYIVLTIYPQNTISLEQTKASVIKLRNLYSGFIFVNYYVKDPVSFKAEVTENITWLSEYANMISVPIPGTVYGISSQIASEIVTLAHRQNLLVAGTICTSQEGADTNLMASLGVVAKQCGFDVHMFGDASASDMPCEENLFAYSKAIRGKRHTYFRMNI